VFSCHTVGCKQKGAATEKMTKKRTNQDRSQSLFGCINGCAKEGGLTALDKKSRETGRDDEVAAHTGRKTAEKGGSSGGGGNDKQGTTVRFRDPNIRTHMKTMRKVELKAIRHQKGVSLNKAEGKRSSESEAVEEGGATARQVSRRRGLLPNSGAV